LCRAAERLSVRFARIALDEIARAQEVGSARGGQAECHVVKQSEIDPGLEREGGEVRCAALVGPKSEALSCHETSVSAEATKG